VRNRSGISSALESGVKLWLLKGTVFTGFGKLGFTSNPSHQRLNKRLHFADISPGSM
jgi:hypothetical protein